MLGKATPPFLGAVLGAVIVIIGELWLVSLFIAVVGAAALSAGIGFKLFRRNPLLGRRLIELWNIGLVALLAIGAATLLALTLIVDPNDVLGWTSMDGEQRKDIVKYVMGAATAFVGVLVTKDIDDAKGPLWPSTFFKKAAGSAFKELKPTDHPKVDAAHLNRTYQNEAIGWGFKARRMRAQILASDAPVGAAPQTAARSDGSSHQGSNV